VATPHDDIADVARRAGAEALVRDDTGLNAAVEAAAADLCERPEDGVLVVLGDVAGARPDEIEKLLAALNGPGVALAPARDGGTSALLRVPRDIIAAGFGPDSAAVHRQRAKSAGALFVEVPLASLAIDVDQREDLEALLAGPAPAPHTRAVWREHLASARQ
jgi:2-phospho-L-lactate guanylyltransferase